ncbi:riboflavin synthase [Chloroflexota bacterium]
MFTGIVEEIGSIVLIKPGKLVISATAVIKEAELGGSIAVNGVCLTMTGFETGMFSVDIMPETSQRTNIGLLHTGSKVNLERPLTMQKPLGGHLVQGHIDDVGDIAAITVQGASILARVNAAPKIIRYMVEKGFIAVDGVSLTVTDKNSDSFQVSIVEFTKRHTILGSQHAGDKVNLEIDIIAKYVEQLSRPRQSGITAAFLEEHGFVI